MVKAEHLNAVFAECGISAMLEVVGERWSFLILRGAFNGFHHFEEFHSTLGIARNILSNRLARLVEHEILERQPDPADRRKVAYRLTDKGKALLPVLIAMRQWGEKWIPGVATNPVLVERGTRLPIETLSVRTANGRPLGLSELEWVDQSEVAQA
jgi:DNA-binding HxlR family transcriptional regulator